MQTGPRVVVVFLHDVAVSVNFVSNSVCGWVFGRRCCGEAPARRWLCRREPRRESTNMVKRSWLVAVLAILAAGIAAPGPAHAEPGLPRPPGTCPGGKESRFGSPSGRGFCDGYHYGDGSFWRIWDYELTPSQPECLWGSVHGGLWWPDPAPPGGCGGAV